MAMTLITCPYIEENDLKKYRILDTVFLVVC